MILDQQLDLIVYRLYSLHFYINNIFLNFELPVKTRYLVIKEISERLHKYLQSIALPPRLI